MANPLGLANCVTEGIVSVTGRSVTEPATADSAGATLPDVIQTSAPINPGNSGGALVNMSGQVIGIPTLAAVSPGGGAQAAGIGFAIPSNTARAIASQLICSSLPHGVTPERFSPTMPARTSPIETILRTDTDSPRTIMPTTAVPAAPIPVHNA